MKTFSIIIVILIVAIVAIAIYINKNIDEIVSRIKFTFKLRAINLSQSTTTIETTIENNNNLFFIFNNLYVKLFYNNQQIANSASIDKSIHFVPLNGKTTFSENINVDANALQLIPVFATNQNVTINYEIDVNIFFVKINTIRGSFTI